MEEHVGNTKPPFEKVSANLHTLRLSNIFSEYFLSQIKNFSGLLQHKRQYSLFLSKKIQGLL